MHRSRHPRLMQWASFLVSLLRQRQAASWGDPLSVGHSLASRRKTRPSQQKVSPLSSNLRLFCLCCFDCQKRHSLQSCRGLWTRALDCGFVSQPIRKEACDTSCLDLKSTVACTEAFLSTQQAAEAHYGFGGMWSCPGWCCHSPCPRLYSSDRRCSRTLQASALVPYLAGPAQLGSDCLLNCFYSPVYCAAFCLELTEASVYPISIVFAAGSLISRYSWSRYRSLDQSPVSWDTQLSEWSCKFLLSVCLGSLTDWHHLAKSIDLIGLSYLAVRTKI